MAIQTLLTNPFRPFQDTGISESVGRGLEALTQHKMQQIQQQKAAQGLSSLRDASGNPMFSSQEASLLVNLAPADRTEYLKQRYKSSQQNDFLNRWLQLQGNEGATQGMFSPQTSNQPSAQDIQEYQRQLQGYELGNKIGLGEGIHGRPKPPSSMMSQPSVNAPRKAPVLPPGILPPTNPKEAMDVAKLQQKEKQLTHLKEKEARDYLQPFFEQNRDIVKNIRSNKLLTRLAGKGDIRSGNVQQLLEKIGLGQFNQPFDNEVATKEIARLGQNIRTAFGGKGVRLTNFLEQTFQKSLPSLWNTPQGIIAISGMLTAADEYTKAVNDIRLNIIQQNSGRIPWDIESQVEQQAAPLEDVYEQKAIDALQTAQFPLVGTLDPKFRKKAIEKDGVLYVIKDGIWQRA